MLYVRVKGTNVLANRWLAIFFLLVGCAMLGCILENNPSVKSFTWLIPWSEATRFVMAPALYFSIQHFVQIRYQPGWRMLFHFVPALLFLFVLMGGSDYLPRGAGLFVWLAIKLQMVAYWVAGMIQLQQHQKQIPSFSSNTAKHSLKWLQHVLWGIGIMMITQITTSFFPILHHPSVYLVYLLATYTTGYFALQQAPIYKDVPFALVHNIQPTVQAPTPRIQTVDELPLKEKLLQCMIVDKLFTIPSITALELAQKMDITVHELSYLLNQVVGQNFYQFINHYRVEEAKRLLRSADHQHINILSIGFEAGFNSKTAFNNTFKKATGSTPTAYRQLVVHMAPSEQ
ncbi:helix-turn-helix protein [Chitinophaga skermanii]|uniref:Helix-turn-helix protein n=1 Tax=Chitinophaga skermanii TaxID=331697 RepID=A0A327QN17_9BACT|nr:helix-turn-helix domain-containing protein [Chitinophaga skermanii]RAJ05438.1 helix-turn-helix protein [Chitinophaga skermanii]